MPSMLPALPKSFGRLADVFVSALGSITGKDNRLALPRVANACVILVDGLGAVNLKSNAGHAPFLAKANQGAISTIFPSTTAAAITTFATGVLPGEHGIVGYQVLDSIEGVPLNLLTGLNANSVGLWQRAATVGERADEFGVQVFSVGPEEYRGSGFTSATMPTATFIGAKSIADRFEAAAKLLAQSKNQLVYIYVPELDQRAHRFGSKSRQWLEALEELNSEVKRFSEAIGKKSGVLLTADHGVIDVPEENHLYLDEYDQFLAGLEFVGGDPRVNFLYFKTQAEADDAKTRLSDALEGRATCVTADQICSAGYYGAVSAESRNRMPQLFLLANAKSAIYHRKFAKAKSLKMIGQHGGVTPEELSVPLIKLGLFS